MNKSYKCKCGIENKFALWLFAHWDLRVAHRCECGRVNELLRGRIVKWGKQEKKP